MKLILLIKYQWKHSSSKNFQSRTLSWAYEFYIFNLWEKQGFWFFMWVWRISFVPNFKNQACTKRIVFTNLSEYSWFIHARILPCVYLLSMSLTMTINFVLRILLENCRLKIIFMRVLAVADLKMVTHSWTPFTN